VKAALLIGASQIAVQHLPLPIGLPVATVFRSATKVLSNLIARGFESRLRALRIENRKLWETSCAGPRRSTASSAWCGSTIRRCPPQPGAAAQWHPRAPSNWRPNSPFDVLALLSNRPGSRILVPEGRFDPSHAS